MKLLFAKTFSCWKLL